MDEFLNDKLFDDDYIEILIQIPYTSSWRLVNNNASIVGKKTYWIEKNKLHKGTIVEHSEYIKCVKEINSNNCSKILSNNDKFKYFDYRDLLDYIYTVYNQIPDEQYQKRLFYLLGKLNLDEHSYKEEMKKKEEEKKIKFRREYCWKKITYFNDTAESILEGLDGDDLESEKELLSYVLDNFTYTTYIDDNEVEQKYTPEEKILFLEKNKTHNEIMILNKIKNGKRVNELLEGLDENKKDEQKRKIQKVLREILNYDEQGIEIFLTQNKTHNEICKINEYLGNMSYNNCPVPGPVGGPVPGPVPGPVGGKKRVRKTKRKSKCKTNNKRKSTKRRKVFTILRKKRADLL
jgi:hypothetical protein